MTPMLIALFASAAHAGHSLESADGDNLLKLGLRIQGRYTFEQVQLDPDPARQMYFSIPRLRVSFSGHAFGPSLKYKFEYDWGKGGTGTKDAWISARLGEGSTRLTLGQFKKPFSRQQLVSSSRINFMERAITDKYYGASRDIGLMLHNGIGATAGMEWAVALVNGTGEKASFSGDVVVDPTTGEGEVTSGKFSNVPDHMHPMLVGRVGYSSAKKSCYDESAFGDDCTGAALSVIADLDADAEAVSADDGALRAEADYIVKASGLVLTGAGYLGMVQSDTSWTAQALESFGFSQEVSYLLSERYAPVVRAAMILPDGDDNNRTELAGGLSIYLQKHALKVQLDSGVWTEEVAGGDPVRTLFARAQTQFAF